MCECGLPHLRSTSPAPGCWVCMCVRASPTILYFEPDHASTLPEPNSRPHLRMPQPTARRSATVFQVHVGAGTSLKATGLRHRDSALNGSGSGTWSPLWFIPHQAPAGPPRVIKHLLVPPWGGSSGAKPQAQTQKSMMGRAHCAALKHNTSGTAHRQR